jgi:hypothetical protein
MSGNRTGDLQALYLQAFRDFGWFFPTEPDELFGYVLHPVDLAANQAGVVFSIAAGLCSPI